MIEPKKWAEHLGAFRRAVGKVHSMAELERVLFTYDSLKIGDPIPEEDRVRD